MQFEHVYKLKKMRTKRPGWNSMAAEPVGEIWVEMEFLT